MVKKKSAARWTAGHPPHLKQLFPPERVRSWYRLFPRRAAVVGGRCREARPRKIPKPEAFSSPSVPPIVVEVTEYQAQGRRCSSCGVVTHATIPAAIRAHSVGPRLTATLSYFTGCHGVSKRAVEEIADTVLGVPIGLGSVAQVEQKSLPPRTGPCRGVGGGAHGRVKYADETG